MFASWFAQNVYLDDLDAEKEQMCSDAQYIVSENSIALQWVLKFQEELRRQCTGAEFPPCPDGEVIANTAKGYASSMGNILEAAARVGNESKTLTGHVTQFRVYEKAINEAIATRDVAAIIASASKLMVWAKTAYAGAKPELDVAAAEVSARLNWWTWVFRASYVAGAVLFALAWVEAFLREPRKNAA